jgi:hypothetical protein
MRWIFWGFCRNWFLINYFHYLSSRSAFGFEFAEIFIIEKRLPDWASRRLSDSAFKCLKENSASQRVVDSPTRESGSCHGVSGSRYSNFLNFSINFPNFKWLNQPFKRSICQKRSHGCNVLSQLIYLRFEKTVSIGILVNSPTRRVGESFFDYEYLCEFEAKIGTA